MTYGHLGIQYGTTRLAFSQFSRAATSSAVTRLCRCSWGGQPSVVAMWAAFYIREVPFLAKIEFPAHILDGRRDRHFNNDKSGRRALRK